jgi:hypothetical protein
VAGTNGASPSSITNELLRRLAPDQLNQLLPYLDLIDLPQREMPQRRGDAIGFACFPETAVVSFLSIWEMETWSRLEWSARKYGRASFWGWGSRRTTQLGQIAGKALRIPCRKHSAAVQGSAGWIAAGTPTHQVEKIDLAEALASWCEIRDRKPRTAAVRERQNVVTLDP